MKNGKEGWKVGTSFLRKPVFIHINMAPGHDNMYYDGTPKVTIHNSLMAVASDVGGDDASNGTNLYNANTLEFIETLDIFSWKTTMLGSVGNKIFVSNVNDVLLFYSGDMTRAFKAEFLDNMACDIPVIGCETHAIVLAGRSLILYKQTIDGESPVLATQSVILGRTCHEINHEGYCFENTINWGADRSEFVVYHSLDNERSKAETCEISVWSFDATTDQITQTQLIEAGIGLRNVVMAEDFIVGACAERKIHVWNRRTKEKMPYILCDVDEDDELARIDLLYARCMSLHGHTFVTNSYLGCALCVWNVKTGELLKKYNDVVDGQWVDLLPDRTDVTSMAYLKHLNGFVLTDGYLKVWTFPTNQDQKDRAVAICRREQDLR